MKTEDIEQLLRSHPFISVADKDVIHEIASSDGCRHAVFNTGEVIYSGKSDDHRIGYIISGKAYVYSIDNNRDVLLRQLTDNDITGVANLFNSKPFVSRIIAATKCKVLFIDGKTFGNALERDSKLMYAYINFLSDKIRYLNNKIVYLTAGSAERRLAVWLESCSDGDTVELPINISSLAEMLNLGRASLYRAFDTLINQGYIKKSGKTFIFTDRCGMIEKYIKEI